MTKYILIAFFACIPEMSVIFAQIPYHITGTWTGGEAKTVYLNTFPTGTPESVCIDSTTVSSDGTFRLSGNLDELSLLSLTIEGSKGFRTLMGDGRPITINIKNIKYSYKQPDAAFTITSDTLEHAAAAYILKFWGNDFIRKISMGGIEGEVEKAKASGNLKEEQATRKKLQECIDTREKEKEIFLTRYGNCLAAPYFIVMNLLKGIPVEETEEFYNRMGEKAKASPKGIELKESIAKMKALAPGAKAPDFTLPTATGEEFSLESLQGHIVILDFWASWCAPCIAEMPTVKEIYAKYKDKGLKVVGISMDNSKAAWMKSIDKIQIPWLHVSSLKGMKRCPVAELYQVYAIPKLYIIDKEGKIVDKDLRGEDLKKKVDELFARQ